MKIILNHISSLPSEEGPRRLSAFPANKDQPLTLRFLGWVAACGSRVDEISCISPHFFTFAPIEDISAKLSLMPNLKQLHVNAQPMSSSPNFLRRVANVAASLPMLEEFSLEEGPVFDPAHYHALVTAIRANKSIQRVCAHHYPKRCAAHIWNLMKDNAFLRHLHAANTDPLNILVSSYAAKRQSLLFATLRARVDQLCQSNKKEM